MKIIDHSILGSGLSALITDLRYSKSTIFTNNDKKVIRSKRFYEYQNLGGNSNIWGGYINFKRYQYLLNNDDFKNFMFKNSIFEVRKFINNKDFMNTYYLSEKNNNRVFRVKKKFFKSKILIDKINKLDINKNYIILKSNNEIYKTRTLSLCVGNLGLIELLYNSKLIDKKDKISFYDGAVNYSLNLFPNHKKNYYIPMSLKEISEKIIYGKIIDYKENINNTLILQKFSKNGNIYSYTVEEIIKFKSKYLRYFLSNHIVGLKVNNIPIKKHVEKITDKVNIKCSGIKNTYLGGPISQDIIFNAFIK